VFAVVAVHGDLICCCEIKCSLAATTRAFGAHVGVRESVKFTKKKRAERDKTWSKDKSDTYAPRGFSAFLIRW
jgi:hypothetical protein